MQRLPLSVPDTLPSPSPDALEVSPALDLEYRHSNTTYDPLVWLLPLGTMFPSSSLPQFITHSVTEHCGAGLQRWLGGWEHRLDSQHLPGDSQASDTSV